MKWPIPLFFLMSFSACQDAFVTKDGKVERGNLALTSGQMDKAQEEYKEASTYLPESPELNYLKGLAASMAGEHQSAHDFLLRALDTKDKGLEQKIKAALGLSYAAEALNLERKEKANEATEEGPSEAEKEAPSSMRSWKLAVGFLEDALVMDPNDMASRQTLEVALIRVDPPCASRDDDFEPNNSQESASLLEASASPDAPAMSMDGLPEAEASGNDEPADEKNIRQQLFSCPDNDDWYAIDLEEGDRVLWGYSLPKDGGRLSLSLHHPDGSLFQELHDPSQKEGFSVKKEDAGRYTLQVKNLDFDEVSYGLDISIRPACWKTDDTFEPNNSPFEASSITAGNLPGLKACPNDEDWYRLSIADGESLFVYASPMEDQGNSQKKTSTKDAAEKSPGPPLPPLQLEITDSEGKVLTTGAPSQSARISTLLTPGEGSYMIRVASEGTGFGDDGLSPFEGRYQLQVEVVPPCPLGDDRFEDNDIPEDATPFMEAAQGQGNPEAEGAPPEEQKGPPVIFARICPGDVDWWSFTSDGEKPKIITASFDHEKGDLDLFLYDESGQSELDRSDTSSKDLSVEGLVLPMKETPEDDADPSADAEEKTETTYKVLVRGQDEESENFYLLQLDEPGDGDGESDPNADPEEGDENEDEQDDSSAQNDDDQAQNEDQQEQEEQSSLEEALDKLDKNPENLQARDAKRNSPLANQKPLKDW